MRYRLLWPTAVVGSVIAIASGCGRGNPLGRLPISGTVTFEGRPLDKGVIEFSPCKEVGTVGTGARIDNGRYAIPTLKGLPPGEYRVRIFSPKDAKMVAKSAGAPGPAAAAGYGIERIPPKYNTRTNIIVTIGAKGPMVFDFDIETK